jgi:hypothetical protein
MLPIDLSYKAKHSHKELLPKNNIYYMLKAVANGIRFIKGIG